MEGGKKAGGEASATAMGKHQNKEVRGEESAAATGRGKNSAGGEEALSSAVNLKDAAPADPFELLDMCVDALYDKYGSARESALASLAHALEGVVPLDEGADGHALDIFALCCVSIKEGNAKEACQAYRAIGLLALTLRNGGSAEILANSFPMLARTLQLAPSMYPMTVTTALDCLTAVSFTGALGPDEEERSLNAVWGVFCPNPESPKLISTVVNPQVVAAAVSTWTVLNTTVTVGVKTRALNPVIASLAEALGANERAVRMAAGEALAVCTELNLMRYTPYEDMDAIYARVSDLAVDAGGKGVSRTLLVEQKELFRQISAFMERGERPNYALLTSLERRDSIKVSTWAEMVQLNFLRRFLAGGFLRHLRGGRLFRQFVQHQRRQESQAVARPEGQKVKGEEDEEDLRAGVPEDEEDPRAGVVGWL